MRGIKPPQEPCMLYDRLLCKTGRFQQSYRKPFAASTRFVNATARVGRVEFADCHLQSETVVAQGLLPQTLSRVNRTGIPCIGRLTRVLVTNQIANKPNWSLLSASVQVVHGVILLKAQPDSPHVCAKLCSLLLQLFNVSNPSVTGTGSL